MKILLRRWLKMGRTSSPNRDPRWRPARPPYGFVPLLEPLESRLVPAEVRLIPTNTPLPPGFMYDAASQTLTITGTNFTLVRSTTSSGGQAQITDTFTVDGHTASFADNTLALVTVNGVGAGANATLYTLDTDPASALIVALWQHGGQLLRTSDGRASVFVQMNSFNRSAAYLGSTDVGSLYATPGETSTFQTHGIYSTMTSASQSHFMWGAPAVNGYAANHDDTAVHVDGSGTSYFLASGIDFSSMFGTDQGQTFYNVAHGFRFNAGQAQHAGDYATFDDSPADDVFIGAPGRSMMYSLDQGQYSEFNQSTGFAMVRAEIIDGGHDVASLVAGDGGSAFLVSGNTYSVMGGIDHGQSFTFMAFGFPTYTGSSSHPGDTATFYDSAGDDVFVGGATSSYMYSDDAQGQLVEYDAAYGFTQVNAYSFVGGFDVATNNDPSHNTVTGFGVHRP